MSPRTVICAPVFGKAEYLPQAIESILAQTDRDFALLLVDDCSGDATPEICRRFADSDGRVVYRRNPERIGMLQNTRRALDLASHLFPEARYRALGSDHDLWHHEWLELLVGELEAHPELVLVYPHTQRISATGEVVGKSWRFDTTGITDPRKRFTRAFRGMVAGDMIYGLLRVDALERVGTYRSVLVPDRLLLTELALHGQFKQVPRLLWSRRFQGLVSLDRQRDAFFLGDAPGYTRLPWWLVHTGAFFWAYVAKGEGRPAYSRRAGVRLTIDYLTASLRHRAWRRVRRSRMRAVAFASYVRHPRRGWERLARSLARRARPRRVVLESIVPTMRRAASALRAPALEGDRRSSSRAWTTHR